MIILIAAFKFHKCSANPSKRARRESWELMITLSFKLNWAELKSYEGEFPKVTSHHIVQVLLNPEGLGWYLHLWEGIWGNGPVHRLFCSCYCWNGLSLLWGMGTRTVLQYQSLAPFPIFPLLLNNWKLVSSHPTISNLCSPKKLHKKIPKREEDFNQKI